MDVPAPDGPAYSFSYLPLQAFNSQDEDRHLEDVVNIALRETSSTSTKGLKAQYGIIHRMIRDPGEATATLFMTRKQRYTLPSNPAQGNYMSIIAMLSHPFSRGSSHIQSKNRSDPPEIKFNYLEHPLDVEILSRHVIQIDRLLKSPFLSTHLKLGGNTLPNGFPREAKEATEVAEYLRDFAATNYHPAGTCGMMSEELDGVVDETLKVYGTEHLRVCDASVIPILPRGNILSTVYALAEKGAEILKEALEVEI
jgi:choline dehydrogenase-like flavoprotein